MHCPRAHHASWLCAMTKIRVKHACMSKTLVRFHSYSQTPVLSAVIFAAKWPYSRKYQTGLPWRLSKRWRWVGIKGLKVACRTRSILLRHRENRALTSLPLTSPTTTTHSTPPPYIFHRPSHRPVLFRGKLVSFDGQGMLFYDDQLIGSRL